MADVIVAGTRLAEPEVRTLIERLVGGQTVDSLAAARLLRAALDQRGETAVVLVHAYRDAVLVALDDPPTGLEELRDALRGEEQGGSAPICEGSPLWEPEAS